MTKKDSKLATFILSHSDHPAFSWVVFFLTVCESIFLFIPPEVFIAPPIVANKKRAFSVTAAAALGSLIGGALAYAIGMWLFDSVGAWLVETFSSAERFAMARAMFDRHGLFMIFLAAFTPVPYKLLAICAGFLQFNPILFIGVSAIFRTLRFAIVAFLLWRFQEQANIIVKKYFWPLALTAILVAALGICLMCI